MRTHPRAVATTRRAPKLANLAGGGLRRRGPPEAWPLMNVQAAHARQRARHVAKWLLKSSTAQSAACALRHYLYYHCHYQKSKAVLRGPNQPSCSRESERRLLDLDPRSSIWDQGSARGFAGYDQVPSVSTLIHSSSTSWRRRRPGPRGSAPEQQLASEGAGDG